MTKTKPSHEQEREEIEVGNKLIAEFDGWRLAKKPFVNSDDESWWDWKKYDEVGNVINSVYPYIEDNKYSLFKYHSSWDWLMPVVEKISLIRGDDRELMKLESTLGSLAISGILNHEYRRIYFINPHMTGIQCWHKSVIDFIKWYNTTKK